MSEHAVMPVGLGASWLALDANQVREVLGRTAMARVPGASGGLVGVVPWRGRAIAVLDLASVLGGEPLDRDRARTVIVSVGGDTIALPVDRVREVTVCSPSRPAHVARVAHASHEVDLEDETLPLFDLAELLDALDRSRA